MDDPTTDVVPLLQLQIMVLALGEAHHAGWWRSQFLSPVGLSHLSYLYPRSNFGAAVRAASRAARAVHDASIGIGDVFHLFRLPQTLERRLDDVLRDSETELHVQFGATIRQKQDLLDRLATLSEVSPDVQVQAGPRRLGTLRDLQRPSSVAAMSSLYCAAFQNGLRMFPYFDGEKGKP
jgi:hypothetical protein